MNKENALFTIVGVLAGLIIGFVFANSVNKAGNAAPLAASQQNRALPPDHPPIDSNSAQQAPDMAAAQAAVKLAKDQPNNFDAQVKAAESHYQIQRYDEALQFLQRANQLRPDDYETIVQSGNVNFDAGRYADAEKWYTAALQKRPDAVNVRTDLGLTFMFREPADLDRAIAEFRRSLDRDPKHVQTLQNLTVAYTRKGDGAQARATLARLEEASPGNAAVSTLRSDVDKLGASPAKSEGAR